MNEPKKFSRITPNLPLWSYQLQRDSKLAVKTRKDLEIYLISSALKNKKFREELRANAKAVVEKELGNKLPETLEIQVIEETETTIYLVLPNNPYAGVTEEELQASLGMTYEDVALWILEQQRNTFLDETSSIAMLARVWRDEAFKQELSDNSKAVIAREWGIEIPDEIEIQVLQETSKILYLVLPIEDNFGAVQNILEAEWENANLAGVRLVVGSVRNTLGIDCSIPQTLDPQRCPPVNTQGIGCTP